MSVPAYRQRRRSGRGGQATTGKIQAEGIKAKLQMLGAIVELK